MEGVIKLLTNQNEEVRNAGLINCAVNDHLEILKRISSGGIPDYLSRYCGENTKGIDPDSGSEYAFQLLLDKFANDESKSFDLIIKSNFFKKAITDDNPYNLSNSLKRSLAIYHINTVKMNSTQKRIFITQSNIFNDDEKIMAVNGKPLPFLSLD